MKPSYWMTKYVLTKGIERVEDCELYVSSGVTYVTKTTARLGKYFERLGKDAHESEAEAKKRAIAMAKLKIQSLDKQRKNLEEKIKEWK